ncbi:Choline-sulfatase [Rubripirellula obstinata]|uniref:Choline-sulfatase n=1 Tax=Rubripirellula obstinata TaxID=406547 RepID=A0A5B1CCF9_9BACT|nr:sulfatase [Rubripirellula obstinata]KAA1257921.1 Choline-sulfatase [Rubripirellula obstinata]
MNVTLRSRIVFCHIVSVICGTCFFNSFANAQNQNTAQEQNADRPNVLMICVDDLNDWIEPLGGHPQVKTPAIKALAEAGLNFRNAHCQSPLCNSSRTSVMLSRRPATTGVHGLNPWFRKIPALAKSKSMPQYFADAGYETYTAGKVYHNSWGRNLPAGSDPEFQHWGPGGWPGITPPKKLIPPTPAGNNPWVDWGVFDHQDNQKGDWKVADWAEEKLTVMPGDKPFFMAVGFFLPHVPCHVTQKWWDMYPEETLQMPPMQKNERANCSPFSWYLHWNLPEPRLSWLEHHNEHKNLVRSYLASISFMDSQVARVMAALEKSSHADNTIICLWSDHGFHLGEKEMMGKTTLWERSTHVPLIFTGKGIEPRSSNQPVELLDVFPTLADLAGLPVPEFVEGVSLVPLITDADAKSKRPAVTEHNPGNSSIRDERYRLIHYADGSEELYDMQQDPNEFNNRIDDESLAEVKERLQQYVPHNQVPLAPGSGQRILEEREDGLYWENQKIDPDNPPMSTGSTEKADLPRKVLSSK